MKLITVTARIPATTANLGPGFDTLGVALSLYNRVRVRAGINHGISFTRPMPADLKRGATDMVCKSAMAFFSAIQKKPRGIEVDLEGGVPIARGLGSSVTVRLGIVAGLNALYGEPLTREDVLRVATHLEGHPDNAAPALLGGFCVSTMINGAPRVCQFELPRKLKFVAAIPETEISTEAARGILPREVKLREAVDNVRATAMITAALASRQYELLRGCFTDHLHQPYRHKLLPELFDVIAAGEGAGALGGWLSGSGSTVICLTLKNPKGVAAAMQKVFLKRRHPCRTMILAADNRGLTIASR